MRIRLIIARSLPSGKHPKPLPTEAATAKQYLATSHLYLDEGMTEERATQLFDEMAGKLQEESAFDIDVFVRKGEELLPLKDNLVLCS